MLVSQRRNFPRFDVEAGHKAWASEKPELHLSQHQCVDPMEKLLLL
jgi:hypothetical protein